MAKPPPAHPVRRQLPLPGQRPKSGEEDPAAPAAVQAILNSPSYREADRDVDFLARDETRGVRLLLDYAKAERVLQDHGVAHTIVVFGGTRIPEQRVAQQAVEACRAALQADPADAALQRRLAVAQRVLANSRFYDEARALGRLIGAAGQRARGGRLVVLTGGGPGIMEAANRGTHDEGARSVGLNIVLPHEQYPNPYVTPELCFLFHYFAIRKLHFVKRARALVVFPGGYGTLDELFEVLALAQTRTINPLPVILVGEAYWRRVFNPDALVEEGVIDPEDRDLFWYAETADEVWKDILGWYESIGQPLLQPDAGGHIP